MPGHTRSLGFASLVLASLTVSATVQAEPTRIDWGELGNVSTTLPGGEIELTGYLLPVDREGEDVHSFLLVPVAGACSHMPTPPANQIVLVTLPQPFRASQIYEPVKVTGKLREEPTMSQLFILDGVKIVHSAYAVGAAHVSAWTDAPPAGGLGNRC